MLLMFGFSCVAVVVLAQPITVHIKLSAKKYRNDFILIFIALFDVHVNGYLVSSLSLTSVNSASTVCDFGCSSAGLADSC